MKKIIFVFAFPVILFAQQNNFLHPEKTLLTSFLIQTNDNPAQKLKQELKQIINKSKSKQSVNENYLIDSLISEFVTGSKSKFLFVYNNEDRMIERTAFFKDLNSDWQIDYKEEYFYDTHLNLIREINFNWNNAEWDSLHQILSEYNLYNKLILTAFQLYDTGNWENGDRTTYTYDQAGNQITSLTELWVNNQWTNSFKVYNYYSPQNRRDSLLSQNWDGNKWQNYWRTSFYYDSLTTFLDLIIAQLWTGNQFQDYLKVNIINNELGNQVQQLEQIWNGSTWVNDIKKDYTYLWYYFKSGYSELWNGTNWVPGDSPTLINNPDGFKIAIITQSIHIYYKIVNVESTNSNTPNDFSLSQNYPNPFNPSTKISWQSPVASWQTLKVYDILGNEVATLVNEEKNAGNYEIDFNVGRDSSPALASGIYFYQLRVGDPSTSSGQSFVETKKMILLK